MRRPGAGVPGLGPRLQAWLRRRIPPARTVALTQRNVFIFPTAFGGLFAVLLLLLLIAAINYQNSLIFALTFLLASTFSAAILQTFLNLAGLRVSGRDAAPDFAGRRLSYRVRLESGSGRRYVAVRLGWPGGVDRTVHVPREGGLEVELLRPAERRGVDRPGRLRIETRHPTGLLRAWSWLDLEVEALVWPRPLDADPPPEDAEARRSGGPAQVRAVGEDLWGLREYQAGDSPRRVAWKQYARRGKLVTKEFERPVGDGTVVDWDAVDGDTELRLSRLCRQVLDLDRAGCAYRLRLPGRALGPDRGPGHREACLRALALFGTEA